MPEEKTGAQGRGYITPRPPKGFMVRFSSNAEVDLSWEGDYTDASGPQPWHRVRIYKGVDGGGLTLAATLMWDAVNYTDRDVSAGHRYEYVAASVNSAGESRTDPEVTYTSPRIYGTIVARRLASGEVEVECDRVTPYFDKVELQVSSDGGEWSDCRTLVQSAPSGSLVVRTDRPGQTGRLTYRVQIKKLRENGTLYLASGWRESQAIGPVTAPLAPTIREHDPVLATATAFRLEWVPNHPDGSVQTAAQVEVTRPGEYGRVLDVSGSTAYVDVPIDHTGTHMFRARTKGVSSLWGEWSAAEHIAAADAPQVRLTSPSYDGERMGALPIPVRWEVADSSGVSGQELMVMPDGGGVSFYNIGPSERGIDLPILANDTDYRLKLTVNGGSGLSATVERTFRTDWQPPAKPTAKIEVTERLACTVTVFRGEGAPDTASLSVARVLPDGTVTELASSLESGQSVTDPLPPLNIGFAYRVTAHAVSGETESADVPFTVDSDGDEAFNYGPGAGGCLRLGYGADGSSSVGHSGESFHFALGAGAPPLPTFYPSGDMDADGSHSYVVATPEDYREAVRVARDPDNAVMWFRDAWGGRHMAACSWSFSYDAGDYMLFKVSAKLEEVVWEEPFDGR